jgi:hypothetical protein
MAGKRLSAADMLGQGRARGGREAIADPTPAVEDPTPAPARARSGRQDVETSRYKRVTVYLTEDQHRWAREAARGTALDGIGASDVIRLAITRLQQAEGLDLARELAEQAWAEVAVYRGRAKRGLPPRPPT